MPWPIADAWNQHLDELNRRPLSHSFTVALVRIEPPFEQGWQHTEHVHPYWQLELVEEAGFSVRLNGQEVFPAAGDFLLIPPQNWHYFNHPDGKRGWSIKFAAAELEERYPAGLLPSGAMAAILHRAMTETARLCQAAPDPEAQAGLEHLIGAVLDLYLSGWLRHGEEHELVRQTRLRIEAETGAGRAVMAGDLAAAAKCSPTYLNRVFKRHLGVPVKVYIDQYRFETARRLLLESGLNITEIAAEMGFDDVFRFSRFFRRMSGRSPRDYRTCRRDPSDGSP